ncbi:Membrane-bound transcription factor site-2 protease [Schistosoma japonicum]|uniref:Membrane-bound transcription factor site-2 protease n=1 Tax=Schistosoma japonicum TaxID=6182 RepID=A0A4Z2DP97_SCHJA|nr:Membrane-bound transcription factor site-2 protease [Schistosoma japonicum]KAH8868671.1 Membrane-bound transcription factor site-2 protease [Schistosoma japonicum]TNN18364.1 Membrane-bound transcription factor site-2 protease [Schistosoma japonicum]
MTIASFVSYFFGVWASVYIIDIALRTHSYTRNWYTEFISHLGISFDLLQARLFTQRLNNIFHYVCRFNCIPWNLWFSCGVIFSAISMVVSICLLSLLAYNTLMHKPIETQVLIPVMPGVNLPTSHLGFYILTLLICAFIHEAGHALAAVRERVRLHGFGIFVFGLYPGAFVDLNTSDLQSLSPFCQLRVYCAGVWHNAVIAIISIIVFYLLPFLLSPGYHVGIGVGVTYLREDSVVTGHRGLSLGDAITRVNSCPVNQQSDWFKCLEEAYTHPSGYCVSGAYLSMIDNKASGPRRSLSAVVSINKLDENESFDSVNSRNISNEDCCTAQSASTHLCFTYLTPTKLSSTSRRYACLPARAVTERTSCNVTSDCGKPGIVRGNYNGVQSDSLGGVSTRSMYCVVPSPPDNSTRLVRLMHNRYKAPAILFLGPLEDLVASIGVSDYVPRWPSILSPNLPSFLGLLCTYLFSLSGALVILNVVPCYALDGQWILKAFMDLFLRGILPSRPRRNMVFTAVLILGSVLLGLNLLLAILFLFFQANYMDALTNPIGPVIPANT